MKIVGISGKDRSGKDTLADLYIEAGYFGYSFGDAVRKHARERHKDEPDPISVKNMTETSNWLRAQFGPDVILKEALAEFEKAQKAGGDYKGVVLYSVRAPAEVDFILEKGGELIWVETSDEIRYERKINNMRPGEVSVTIDEMLAQEGLQSTAQPGVPVEVQMNLPYVKEHATKIFKNEGDSIEDFKKAALKEFGL